MFINRKYANLENFKNSFFSSEPFPHVVLDDFIDNNYFDDLTMVLKNSNITLGKNFNSAVESNKAISLNSELPSKLKEIIDYLNSEEWVKNLSKLTEINDIFPVTSTNEHLANYHEMRESGNLAPHVDHSHEPVIGKPHVLNIIIYLSDDWDEKLGGNTLLYDEKGKKIKIKIPYKKNRAIIFLHTPYSFHGVEKITNTTNSIRKTIYVDYYSKSLKPFDNLNLNISKKWFKHGTTFIFQNKLDYLKPKNISYTRTFFRYKISEILSKFT
jgi:Rps23 Pro-64 3,4-dihydroxylase Tpa1-like proline 4-hydroxylase